MDSMYLSIFPSFHLNTKLRPQPKTMFTFSSLANIRISHEFLKDTNEDKVYPTPAQKER